jgi:hypothetical protein
MTVVGWDDAGCGTSSCVGLMKACFLKASADAFLEALWKANMLPGETSSEGVSDSESFQRSMSEVNFDQMYLARR